MKNPWVAIAVIVVVLVGGSVWYSMGVEKTYNQGVVVTNHVTGPQDAKVTLVEYGDFQCPACGQFEPAIEKMLAEYGDQIKFEFKNFPLLQIHPFAEAAAIAAEAAGQQNKYFEYHNMLYAKQAEWTKGIAPGSYFMQYAKDLGLNADQFSTQLKSSMLQDKVRADYKAAMALGLTSTPTFFLNGTKMSLTNIDDFKAQVARAIDPTANFGVTAGDDTIKAVQVTDASGTPITTPDTTTPAAAGPAVNFGL